MLGDGRLGRNVRTGLLTVLIVLVLVALLRPTPGATRPAALAAELNDSVSRQPGVSASTAAYLPGTGVVIASTVAGTAPSALPDVLAAALNGYADRLAQLPRGEALSWQATTTEADRPPVTTMLRVGSRDVGNVGSWQVVPASAASVGGPSAAPTDGLQPLVAPTPAPTAPSAGMPTPAAPDPSSAAKAPATAADGKPAADDFAAESPNWSPLAGSWSVSDGSYRQQDAAGFDFISQFAGAPPKAYAVSVRLRGIGKTVNGGLVLGQPQLGSRSGATLVDLAGTDYLRWGSYDKSSGTYAFKGGANVGAQDARKWHTLAVDVRGKTATITWDGKKVGTMDAVGTGYLGLVTSQSAVEFDDFEVVAG